MLDPIDIEFDPPDAERVYRNYVETPAALWGGFRFGRAARDNGPLGGEGSMTTVDDKQGGGNRAVAVPTAEIRLTDYAPTVVISGPTYVRVNDPRRGISTGRRSDAGTIEVTLEDRATAGTPNELWILKTLSQAMTASGRRVFG